MAVEDDFFEAVKANDVSRVTSLLGTRSDLLHSVSQHAKTSLHWAAEKNAVNVAAVLLDSGADIDAETDWGDSALDWAAALGSREVVELLLARGASGYGLLAAAGLGKLDDVRSIVESGQDLSAHRRHGAPPAPDQDHWFADSAYVLGDVLSDALYAAARNGHTDLVTYLLDRGANVDARGVFGGTGLHWAALNGHRDTVAALLARGASTTIEDHRFCGTPRGWALEGGHTDIAELLSRVGVAR